MYYLILNPVAGRGRSQAALATVKAFMEAQNMPFEVLPTQAPGHATELVKALPTDAKVLSLGGDGTLHEVAAACIESNRVIGILPAGSGDDFAFALGIDRNNLQQALSLIKQGRVLAVDTATVNGQSFINAFGVGFDADVAYAVRHAPKALKERSAYLYAIVSTLSKLKNIAVEIQIDGQKVFAGPALLVSTQNGPRTGGSFMFAPQASVTDGLLDVLVAGEFNRLGTLSILPRVMRGTHLSHPKVFAFSGKEIKLHWEKARPGHMEGELLAAATTFEIKLKPKSLRVFAK
jgi:YegS/Rv2252/BmrU family lipid kinase